MTAYGGIETGGSKWECAVGSGPDDLRAAETIPTTTPADTIERAVAFFEREGPVDAIGIGSFGPIDQKVSSPTWGHITTTPKPEWPYTDLAGPFARRFGVPVGFDTDVNGAALAEHRWGAAHDLDTFCYFTIGTGIGGGAMVNGSLVHGALHPEMGHLVVRHNTNDDPFPGRCPYHGDCFEGMACGPAMQDRWGVPAETLADDHPAWDLEALYIADAMRTVVCVLSPQRIILGGGVMSKPQVLPLVRAKLLTSLNGYIQAARIVDEIDTYVVAPSLGDRSGVLGAIALAQQSRA